MEKKKASKFCRFKDCRNNSSNHNVHMFRFPKEDLRCKLWIEATGNPKLDNIPAAKHHVNSYMCGDHFQDWCFMNINLRNKLVHNAVPNCTKELSIKKLSPQLEDSDTEPIDVDVMPISSTEPAPSPMSQCSATTVVHSQTSSTKKYTPRKVKLSLQLKKQRDANRRIKCRRSIFKIKSSVSLKDKLEYRNVNHQLSDFIQRQVQLSSCSATGKRYTSKDKRNAYQIYSKSHAAYKLLRKFLQLPSETTLQRFVSSKLSTPGINSTVINALKNILEKKCEKDKLFALVFDEMSLKPYLTYDQMKDCVVGFEDFGSGSRSDHPANQALVFMLRSLTSRKKLPIGFYFSKHAMPSAKLKTLLFEILETLSNVGAKVKALICDQGANNCGLFSALGIKPDAPFFTFKEQKVFAIYDPPHLLKSLRRNLMKHDLQSNKGCISFKHIRSFYEVEKHMPAKCAPKLTDKHIYAAGMNAMKVGLASQVFSNSVSAGMNLCLLANLIDAAARPTVEFVRTINDLFDSMNGTSLKPFRGKPYHSAVNSSSPHQRFWREMLENIASWSFVEGSSAEPGHSRKVCVGPRCKSGWTITLSAMLMLSEELLANLDFLMPGRFNQDCIENFFSRIRGNGGNRTNPTVQEFLSSYRIASVNVCSSKFTNCEPDGDKLLFYLLEGGDGEDSSEGSVSDCNLTECLNAADPDDELVNNISFDSLDILEQNVYVYLAGYVAHKILCKHSCVTCEQMLVNSEKVLSMENMYIYFKEYNCTTKYGLKYPNSNFVECFTSLMASSRSYFSKFLSGANLLNNLKQILSGDQFLNFTHECKNHQNYLKENILNITANLLLKIHLRWRNRSLLGNVTNLKNLRDNKFAHTQ